MFISGKKLIISLVFITQSYSAVSKNTRLISKHYFIMKIWSEQELQKIAFNHSWDVDFKTFMNLYKKCAEKLHSFFVTDATLASDNSSRFRNNVLERI